MKGVMSIVPPDVLADRQLTGAHRWDEMWEEVLHMPPTPNREHQDLEASLEIYLRLRWAPGRGGEGLSSNQRGAARRL